MQEAHARMPYPAVLRQQMMFADRRALWHVRAIMPGEPEHNVLERAFSFARSGTCRSTKDIADHLRRAGFTRGRIEEHLYGKTIRKQLNDICKSAVAQLSSEAHRVE